MSIPSPTHEWRGALLYQLGAPTTAPNLQALAMWAQDEGMPAWTNNPLATTEGAPGARNWNSTGVKIYPDADTGILATARTLKLPAYHAIVRALQNGTSLYAIWSAINRSPWCAGCQGGLYPRSFHDRLNNPPPPGLKPGTQAAGPPAPVPHIGQRRWDYSETVKMFGTDIAKHASKLHGYTSAIHAAVVRSTGLR